jgi:hypothetical protein
MSATSYQEAYHMRYEIITPLSLAKDILRFHAREIADAPGSNLKTIYRNILKREFSLNFSEKEIKEILRKSDTLLELTYVIFLFERRSKENTHYTSFVLSSIIKYFAQEAPQEYENTYKKIKSFSKFSGTA